ncbi:serpin family protein [Myxococcota bacterium]|nr:serpin family protein [Myxococcota bacterium]
MVTLLALLLACKDTPQDSGTDDTAGDGGTDGDTAGDGGTDGGTAVEPPGQEVASSTARETDPDATEAEVRQLSADDAAFGLDMYRLLAASSTDNLFLSPHSVSVALAMAWAGAEGDTEAQMASALRWTLAEDRLHPAMNALDLALATRDEGLEPDEGDGFQLSIVNQLFGQEGFAFEAPFLDTLALHYGAGLRLLDFATDPDGERARINDWVEEVTADRIVDLLPEGSVSTLTRLVLVNAIYFKASWQAPFEPEDTGAGPFTRQDGSTVTVDMMHGGLHSLCATGTGFSLAELPYAGNDLAMTLLLPDLGAFPSVEASLTGEELAAALASLETCALTVALPRFSFRTTFNARDPLTELGMVDAFTDAADFSGMSTTEALRISGVYHQAFVAVDEQGTEAAAATAVVEDGTSAPPPVEMTLDRPFLFLIRDRPTGAVLFLGRVTDPSAG